ncbi:uncharacterized protein N7483_005664 [Penicillium malachiteum]|uniref:uncharacterized protein n=1 Tax=Penicillium malachiteum TaxID=1324776 RepID=UPI002548971A|nr:uncharacterized protein N7483_005664 [Penicillium malachiteum]KAJ5731156.1 hypothetical protein N7483_005664 [Penicillium malachiteum]
MPSDYTLERTHGQESVLIHAADLYLLEEWQNDFTISDDAQRSAIFSKWLDIGSHGRMDWKPYVERLEDMSSNDDDITDDEKYLIARVRHPSDRQDISYSRVVRTFYGEGSAEKLAELAEEAEFDQTTFDNAELYDAGSNDGLQSLHDILTRIPQIIEEVPLVAIQRVENMQETRKEAIEHPEFGSEYHKEMFHKAAKWDHVLIYDKEANDEGDVLLVYFDDRGRVIRYGRVYGAEDWQAADGMLWSGQDLMHRWWDTGDYGEDWKPDQFDKRWAEFENEDWE